MRIAWLLLSLLVLACEPQIPEGRFSCATDEDCPPALVCRANVSRCYATQVDAGPAPDGG